MTTVYCDESGFSGSNLYGDQTRHFVYSSVAIEPHEAAEAMECFKGFVPRLQGEPYFSSLFKRREGREALNWLMEQHRHRVRVWHADKVFAAAGKFFDYVVEPVISEMNSVFYRLRFHQFVANVLYAAAVASKSGAGDMIAKAQEMVRTGNADAFFALLTDSLSPIDPDSPYRDIADFAVGYRDKIVDELDGLSQWAMDLSGTGLFTVVRAQAERHPNVTVICDVSKPLQAEIEYTTALLQTDIGRLAELVGIAMPAQAQLLGPVQFVKSSGDAPGIQLADLFAGITRAVLEGKERGVCDQWLDQVGEITVGSGVGFEESLIDLDLPGPYHNAQILKELARRARQGLNPLDGLWEFILKTGSEA